MSTSIPIDWIDLCGDTVATNVVGGVLVRHTSGGMCFVPGLQVVPPRERNESAFGPERPECYGYLRQAVRDYQDA